MHEEVLALASIVLLVLIVFVLATFLNFKFVLNWLTDNFSLTTLLLLLLFCSVNFGIIFEYFEILFISKLFVIFNSFFEFNSDFVFNSYFERLLLSLIKLFLLEKLYFVLITFLTYFPKIHNFHL